MIDRDAIVEFIENRKTTVAIVLSSVLGLIVIILILSGIASRYASERDAREAERRKAFSIPIDELWFPAEPLTVPGVILSRDGRSRWTAEDARRWYTLPDERSLESLRAASRKRVEDLLESVP